MSVNEDFEDDFPEVQERGSDIGASGLKSKIMFIAIIVCGSLLVFYFLFFSGDKDEEENKLKEKEVEQEVIKEIVENSIDPIKDDEVRVQIPQKPPSVPPLVIPDNNLQPPPPIPEAQNNIYDIIGKPPQEIINEDEARSIFVAPPSIEDIEGATTKSSKGRSVKDRRSAGMIAFGGGGSSGETESGSSENFNASSKPKDSNVSVSYSSNKLGATSSSQVRATSYGSRDTLISQGKTMEVILETAINTDIPGPLRAIVAMDIYSEAGNNILIPKGTKMIGEYSSASGNDSRRVNIIWKRIIRSDGVDININYPAMDELGGIGVTGDYDSKFIDTLRNSLLISSIQIGGNFFTQKDGDKIITSVATDGTKTTTTPANYLNKTKIVDDMKKLFSDYINRAGSLKPTITIDQGTKIVVFCNNDIVIPPISNIFSVRNE